MWSLSAMYVNVVVKINLLCVSLITFPAMIRSLSRVYIYVLLIPSVCYYVLVFNIIYVLMIYQSFPLKMYF